MKPRLPHHVAFQIHVEYSKYTIKRVVIDEGVATCVMSLVCWKALDSPTLSRLSNMLTTFDSHSFHPHSILPAFLVQLGGKMVEVEVEVVDAPLDYNFYWVTIGPMLWSLSYGLSSVYFVFLIKGRS